jgi:L-seryl-tRNA(Ser) seleniumtransferase
MSDPRRQLPSVDALLTEESVAALTAQHPRALVVRAVRAVLHAAREDGGAAPAAGWARAVSNQLGQLVAPSLIPVINATGVVLHTNLGRALLAASAVRAMTAVAQSYASVEYDLGRGARGSRHAICRDLLMELTGAEDALVVNNAAAALLLALSALARDGDAIVSRGELVEIGGAFRVPDVMARSGTTLVEVGTTNRTHLDDYVRAITPRTRALLKVHRSNFRVTGFTAEVGAAEIAQLARASGAASLYDLGSGLLLDLSPWGLTGEPTVREAVASNVDIVVCSGDKLLGGPQAGIVLGKKQAIAACKTDPLARAVRSDKFTLAGLEATLALYRDVETARKEIPTLRMLTEDVVEIRRRGEAIKEGVEKKDVEKKDVERKSVELIEGFSEVGGGSFPEAKLPTCLVRLSGGPRPSGSPLGPDRLIELLRAGDPPIIARIEDDHVVLDPRTILPGQEEMVAQGIRAALDD